ncbi:MAG: hypothetical protein OFPII_01010 [Osedax symbiont Rs1]|nr:MAG: hypothetical protein OFPII_01010 [Osedax symbiont Rs1]
MRCWNHAQNSRCLSGKLRLNTDKIIRATYSLKSLCYSVLNLTQTQ